MPRPYNNNKELAVGCWDRSIVFDPFTRLSPSDTFFLFFHACSLPFVSCVLLALRSETVNISADAATALLRYFSWNRERLFDQVRPHCKMPKSTISSIRFLFVSRTPCVRMSLFFVTAACCCCALCSNSRLALWAYCVSPSPLGLRTAVFGLRFHNLSPIPASLVQPYRRRHESSRGRQHDPDMM